MKKVLLLTLFFFSLSLFTPKTASAVDFQEILTSGNSIVVKIQEGVEYFLAFKIEQKVQVLEKHAEKRLVLAQGFAEEGNEEKVQNMLQNYLQIKERQNDLLGKTSDGDVLGAVEERTIEQQKTMEGIKTKIDSKDGKQEIVQVQEQVVNQVAKRVIDVNGSEGQTEFFQKVEHVWAPGTGPGGTAGVVIEGGTMQFAPGTSAGGASGADIKNVVIEGGAGSGGTTVEGGGTTVVGGGDSGGGTTTEVSNPGTAPDTSSGGGMGL